MPINIPGKEKPWAAHLHALMTRMGIKQSGLAQMLGISQVAVSKWMRGQSQPGAKAYHALSQLAGDTEDGAYFTEQLIRLTPGFIEALGSAIEREPKRGAPADEAISVPLLKNPAAAGEPLIMDDEIEAYLSLPPSLCPHPKLTRCVKVKGDSMSPIIRDGYIAAVDAAHRDPRELVGEMVAAGNPEGGVTLKWLRKSGAQYLLVPQHTSPRYNPVVLSEDKRWRIIGRVIWWIGFPPPKK